MGGRKKRTTRNTQPGDTNPLFSEFETLQIEKRKTMMTVITVGRQAFELSISHVAERYSLNPICQTRQNTRCMAGAISERRMPRLAAPSEPHLNQGVSE